MLDRKREGAKVLVGAIALDEIAHILLTATGSIPLTFAGVTISPTVNVLEIVLWPFVMAALMYYAWIREAAGGFAQPYALSPSHAEDPLARELREGYPSNHRYAIESKPLIPGPELLRRWREVEALYPSPLTSLLDVGCCKGFFVLDAALRPGCRTAVGIDVQEGFVGTASAAAARVRVANARFHFARWRRTRPHSAGRSRRCCC